MNEIQDDDQAQHIHVFPGDAKSGDQCVFPGCTVTRSREVVPVQSAGPDTVERVVRILLATVRRSLRGASTREARTHAAALAREVVAAVGPVGRSCEVTHEYRDALERIVACAPTAATIWPAYDIARAALGAAERGDHDG